MLVGKKDENDQENRLIIEGTDKPNEQSIFTEMVRFNARLLQTLGVENIRTVEDVINQAPYLCQNMNFKKIIWEEFHD